MTGIANSRFHMFQGVIALAWADHVLTDEEKQGLHSIITNNAHMSEDQKAQLHGNVDIKINLSDIWPNITDKQDRANLLDLAHSIFLKDGKLCATEQELYDNYLAAHMDTLDEKAIMQELVQMAENQRKARAKEEKELAEYAKQFSMVERIKKKLSLLDL